MLLEQNRFDAYSGVASDALKAVLRARATQYRPARWRSILPVTVGGLPEWARSLEQETTESFVPDFVPAGQSDRIKPVGTEQTDFSVFGTLKLLNAFVLLDDEISAYAASGKSPSPVRLSALETKAEQMLNDIMAFGYTASKLPGFLNHSAAASPTDAQIKLGTVLGDWKDGSDDAETIRDSLIDMVLSFHNNSLEIYDANKIILPTGHYDAAATTYSEITGVTALEMFRAAYPNVVVQKWNKCNAIGTNSNGRAVVGTFARDVIESRMIYEMRTGKRIQTHDGVEVGVELKTAGTIVYEKRGIQFHDVEAP